MKKILFVLLTALLLAACGGNETERLIEDASPVKVESDNAGVNDDLTVDGYIERLNDVFKQMGSKTNLQVGTVFDTDDNTTNIRLSDDTIIIASTNNGIINQLSLQMEPDAFYSSNDDFNFAFLLLVGTSDTTLSFGERNLTLRELGLDDKSVFDKKYKSDTKIGTFTFQYEGNPKTEYTLTAKW